MTDTRPLLEVTDLVKHYAVRGGVLRRRIGTVHAVDGVSFSVGKGETLGLVGESGCGKSTVARTVLRLVEPTSGSIRLNGQDIAPLSKSELRPHRRSMQIVFQDPFASLNPRMTAGDIVGEPLGVHGLATGRAQQERVAELFAQVGLRADQMKNYPHQFSGGQHDFSYLFIAHDLAVVAHISHRVAVMYLGRIVEIADKAELFANPRHPYTQALLAAVPVADPKKKNLTPMIDGDVPSPINPPSGCAFHTRCRYVMDRCKVERPVLAEAGARHEVACWLNEGTGRPSG
jgi:oligopeptide transport system ATP-binding protein